MAAASSDSSASGAAGDDVEATTVSLSGIVVVVVVSRHTTNFVRANAAVVFFFPLAFFLVASLMRARSRGKKAFSAIQDENGTQTNDEGKEGLFSRVVVLRQL